MSMRIAFLMAAIASLLVGVGAVVADQPLPAGGVVHITSGTTPLGPGFAEGLAGGAEPAGIQVGQKMYLWRTVVFYDDPTLEGGVLLVDLDGAVVLTFAGAPCTDGICPYASDPFGNGSAAFAYQVEISVQPEPTAVRPTRRAPLFGGDRPPSRARASQGGPGATVVQTVGMTLTVGGGGFDLTTGYNQATGQGLLGPDDFVIGGNRLALERFQWSFYQRRFHGTLESGMVWPPGVSLDAVTVDGVIYRLRCYIESNRKDWRCGSTGFFSPWSVGEVVAVTMSFTVPPNLPPPTATPQPTRAPSLQTTGLPSPGIDRTQWNIDGAGTLHGQLVPPAYTPVFVYDLEWRPIGTGTVNLDQVAQEDFALNIPFDGVPSYVIEVRVRAKYAPGSDIYSADRTQQIAIPATDDPWVTIWSPWATAVIATPPTREVTEDEPTGQPPAGSTGLRDAAAQVIREMGVGSVEASNNLAQIILGIGWIGLTLIAMSLLVAATGGSTLAWFGAGIVGLGLWSAAVPFGVLEWYAVAIGYALVLTPLGLYLTGKLGVR